MTILIIEDEPASANRLMRLIQTIDPETRFCGIFDSVDESVSWLRKNQPPDLIFMDIQLADGLSFDIFPQVEVSSPVIFITAFDEYALEAFHVNSIDYLLKPVDKQSLERTFRKFSILESGFLNRQREKIQAMQIRNQSESGQYKSRFLVKQGKVSVSLLADQLAGAMVHKQVIFLVTTDGKRFLTDYTLDQLESLLNPKLFFRINRQLIIHHQAIRSIEPFFNSRQKLHLTPGFEGESIVSREKVADFKVWLEE
ncbi:MAG: LytTR family DNA-binding domain-containing protein [Bacteroidetes bacterium]|nr:LytTR family DNA-binding domain-containing protein [Bacteroidota bacterium]